MKKLFLLLLGCFLLLSDIFAQEVLSFVDNPKAKSIVMGFKGYPVTSYRDFLSLQIENANFTGVVYRNVVTEIWGRFFDPFLIKGLKYPVRNKSH